MAKIKGTKKAVTAFTVETGAPVGESRGGNPMFEARNGDAFVGKLYGRQGTKGYRIVEIR